MKQCFVHIQILAFVSDKIEMSVDVAKSEGIIYKGVALGFANDNSHPPT